MKRFVLFIAALAFLVGCSSNSPVAPGDTIYNVTGGEALFKVELKDYPLVVDSVVGVSIYGREKSVYAHSNIPLNFDPATVLCVKFPDGFTYVSDDMPVDFDYGRILSIQNGLGGFVVDTSKNNVLDSISFSTSFRPTLKNDTIEVNIIGHFNSFSSDTLNNSIIIDHLKTVYNQSWFTFKVYTAVKY